MPPPACVRSVYDLLLCCKTTPLASSEDIEESATINRKNKMKATRYELISDAIPVFIAIGLINSVAALIERSATDEEDEAIKLCFFAIITYLCGKSLFYIRLIHEEEKEKEREKEKEIEKGGNHSTDQVPLNSKHDDDKNSVKKSIALNYATKVSVEATGFAINRLFLFFATKNLAADGYAGSKSLGESFGIYILEIAISFLWITVMTLIASYVFTLPRHLVEHMSHFDIECFSFPMSFMFLVYVFLALGLPNASYLMSECDACSEGPNPYHYNSYLYACFPAILFTVLQLPLMLWRLLLNPYLPSKSMHNSHGGKSLLTIAKEAITSIFGSEFAGYGCGILLFLAIDAISDVGRSIGTRFIIYIVISIVTTLFYSYVYMKYEKQAQEMHDKTDYSKYVGSKSSIPVVSNSSIVSTHTAAHEKEEEIEFDNVLFIAAQTTLIDKFYAVRGVTKMVCDLM